MPLNPLLQNPEQLPVHPPAWTLPLGTWHPGRSERRRARQWALGGTLLMSGLWGVLFHSQISLLIRSGGPARSWVDEAAPISWLRLLPSQATPTRPDPPPEDHPLSSASRAARGPASRAEPLTRRVAPVPPQTQAATALTLVRSSSAQASPMDASAAVATVSDSPAVAAAAASAASAPPPLRLDAEVMRSAIQASKGLAQRQAELSGTYMGDEPVSKQEKLARAIAGAAKPGCLAEGGSLLSVFTMAYATATDKCRGWSK